MIRLRDLPWGLTAALLAAPCLNPVQVAAGPSINVDMKAAFHSAPYLIELLETAAQENATSYFPILDRIADGYFSDCSSDKDFYDTFVRLLGQDGHITGAEALSTFKLALSMRSSAPKVEAHYQYYRTAVKQVTGEPSDCADWVLLQDQRYCAPEFSEPRGTTIRGTSQSRNLPFDRTLGTGPSAVLYADLTSSQFAGFHKALVEKARNGEISYRLRHRPSDGAEPEALPVNGYGVKLDLKRTDYIVIDDREAKHDESQKEQKVASEVMLDDAEEVTDLKPLSASEVSNLGIQAGSFIMQSDSPLDTLLKLSQDFPKYSTSLATHNTSEAFLTEHTNNRMQLAPSGINVLWMNGVQLIERQIEPFTLVHLLRRERKLINGVQKLGLTGKEAVSLLSHPQVAAVQSEDEPPRFDWRDDMEDGEVIIFLNNIEKDKRYEDFSPTLMALLQPTMPGSLPSIRRDMSNLVIPVDFTKPLDAELVSETLLSFVKRALPVRFGIAPLTPTQEAADQAKVVYYLLESYGLSAMITYLESSSNAQKTSKPNQSIFDQSIKDRQLRPEATALSLKEVVKSEHYEKRIQSARHYTERLGADSSVPPLFVNGIAMPRGEGWLGAMSQQVSMDVRKIQEAFFYGRLEEDAWIPGIFLEKAAPRRNMYIVPEDAKALKIIDVDKAYAEHDALLAKIPVIEANGESTRENWAALTVVADLTSVDGKELLLAALQFRDNNPGIRMDIVHNPPASTGASRVNSALMALQGEPVQLNTMEALDALLAEAKGSVDNDYDIALADFLGFAKLSPGDKVLILNGRIIGPISAEGIFKEPDFQTLLEFEQANRILPVYSAIDELQIGAKVSGPLAAAKLTSITALSTISDLPEGIFESAPTLRTSAFNQWNDTHTSFGVGDSSTATIQLTALINPASESGQRWVPILKVLSELEGVHLKVFLNPSENLKELPIKRFYRYVLESQPSFDKAGKIRPLAGTFTSIPSEALLTVGMDVPPAWLVAPKVSIHDLDNIKLGSIKSNVDATYELENILIEGHSREHHGGAPRGVQLDLATENDPHFADTIVMANLGFFQFKANPGFYNIKLKEGRSSEIFQIESAGSLGWAPVPGDEVTEIALVDFQGATIYPRINRKPGMEMEDVLVEGKPEPGSAMDYVNRGLNFAQGILGGAKSTAGKSVSDVEHAEINIFSVASGHLYERMLNIMMVSVIRHTNHTVKFWFIEQFLSPSFKDFIPSLAEEYGFKYEMVTYKWPHWLRQQKEKQREIWGYKILFLDVLFPLSLDKVIFVDADQVVRTDMHDLVQHNLEGAPYGFAPMCDSRTEMEGFRFWKQGYWANYLRGQPYHISALYVVDLRRFREMAAGDRLRQQYHSLSADPGSLANLDQDLPNHMQFAIPIHTLPQDWLWCETWCADDALASARTIDLCNNPQTKEPKLDRARRQVPEWTVYDDEIAALDRRRRGLAEEGKTPAGEDDKNPKSRRFEEPGERSKDEL